MAGRGHGLGTEAVLRNHLKGQPLQKEPVPFSAGFWAEVVDRAESALAAGLDGVERGKKLTTKPITGTNVGAENIPRAPRSLIETTRIFRESKVARDWFGDDFVDHFAATREWEWRQWQDAVTDWELRRYFEIV